jgi:DNA-binding CsgD family transcriptional regulator
LAAGPWSLSLCRRGSCPFDTPCSHEIIEATIAASPAPAFVVCVADGDIVWCNDEAARLGPLEGRLIGSMFTEAGRTKADAFIATARLEGFAVRTFEEGELSFDSTGSVELRAVRISDDLEHRQLLVYIECRAVRRGSASGRLRDLERALQSIARELAWVGVESDSRAPASFGSIPGAGALNEREREVLRLVAHGQSVATIAQRLFVSASTVRNYLSSIYRKLGVRNRAALLDLVYSQAVVRSGL